MLRKVVLVTLTALVLLPTTAALGAFPYAAGDPDDYTTYRQPSGANQAPDDQTGKLEWMYSSTPGDDAPPGPNAQELDYVRGAHVSDDADEDQAWRTTTGRPDVAIAILDSGIKWDDAGAMDQLRKTTRISTGETPVPVADRDAPLEGSVACADYDGTGLGGRDLNDDGVFNVLDYACDERVERDPAAREADGDPRGVGPANVLDPQDVLIAFTGMDLDGDGSLDDDDNGYPDDMVGWDFLDDDNDPYDDVQYGHGTGEAIDSVAEADNGGGGVGTCPNCMGVHLRVGTSFIADVNRFALAVIYAVDNDVLVVQDALGTLNKSHLGRQAVKYAWDHGVTTIASAADEAAQHNNWPSSYPHVILVNSVTHTEPSPSYLNFNGCTNFNAKIDLAIPSVSCSSDATGRAAGMAGLVYSAAKNAHEAGQLDSHPSCNRIGGADCLLSSNEVKQLMASGILGSTPVADDVNFAQDPLGIGAEQSCRPLPQPSCMDPFLGAPPQRIIATVPRSYPARKGHDQFYGYGRVNMNRVVDAIQRPVASDDARIPPEVEVTGPEWYQQVDPEDETLAVRGTVWARGATYTCQVLVAPGGYPGEMDFEEIDSTVCDGAKQQSMPLDGVLGTIAIDDLEGAFPPTTDFSGPEHGTAGEQPHSGRPNSDPYGFVVKVTAKLVAGDLTGQDRRKLFLHRDADMLDGFPKQLPGDGEASPLLADLDGDNRNELIVANSDGIVHAWRRDGSEIEGFPVHTDPLPRQTGKGYVSGAIDEAFGAVLATPASGDLDRDGVPELVISDLEGKVYVFAADGALKRKMQTSHAYAGIPLAPFADSRRGQLNRTQLGFIGAPVLADLDGDDDGRLEIVAAAMDRHVYAWNDDGTAVPGWPVLTVDRSKVASVDPDTHQITFKPDAAADFQQGAIVDTPAVGDLDGGGDGRPEVVVGTNESYREPVNAGGFDEAAYSALGTALETANGRLFAIRHDGEPDADLLGGASPYRDGWPFKVGILQAGVLPLVGEGITGSPVIGSVGCNSPARSPRVGTIPAAGIAYLVNPDGQSCYGRTGGKDNALPSSGGASTDQPFLAAFGHPAFGELAGGPAFLTPAAGVQRALDVVLPEYQGGEDQLVAYQTETRTIKTGWPAQVNDLQFLTGPSIGDVDGLPGEEVVAGTSSMDLQAFTSAGSDVPGWPKLTGDWTVANPAIGTFGTLDTDADVKKVVVGLTRSGKVLAYETGAGPCAPASWPRFHHDNANSGDTRRDAVPPGRPADLRVEEGEIRWTAAGDDLLCGEADHEVVTSPEPITGANFDAATPIEPGAPTRAAGDAEAVALPDDVGRYVAVRAVDEAGQRGRVATLDLGASAGDGGGGPGPVAPGPGGTPTLGPGGGPGTGGSPSGGCVPTRRLRRATVRSSGGRLRITVPGDAGAVAVDVFQQSVGRRVGDRLVARFRGRRASFEWNGRATLRGRAVRDGILMVRFRAGGESKRFAVQRSRGRFRVRPGYYRPALCRVLASAKLLRPVFGGRSRRGLTLAFRLTTEARVAITVVRGGRTVQRFGERTYPARRTFRLRVASRRRGDHRVRIVATAGGRTDRVVLVARRL